MFRLSHIACAMHECGISMPCFYDSFIFHFYDFFVFLITGIGVENSLKIQALAWALTEHSWFIAA